MGNRIWSKTQGIVHGAELRSIRQSRYGHMPMRRLCLRPGGWGELPIMAYTGRLRPKGVFFRFQGYERWGFHYN